MVDLVNASQTAQACKTLDIAEHQRLLYVSMTRARDLMILALPESKTSGEWMETLIGVVRSPDAEALGQALHAVITAEAVNLSSEDALEVTKRIIEGHRLVAHLEPQGVLGAVRAFLKFVQGEFRLQRMWAEYPITHVLDNSQIVKGWIDLLIETEANWAIIDHKSSIQNEDRLKETALKYSGQLFCYKKAVEAASGKTADCWIHYPISGHLVRIE